MLGMLCSRQPDQDTKVVFFRNVVLIIFSLSIFNNSLAFDSKNDVLQTYLSEGGFNDSVVDLVRERKVFHGMAGYYNNVDYYLITPTEITAISDKHQLELFDEQWVVAAGRYNVLATKVKEFSGSLDQVFSDLDNLNSEVSNVVLASKPELTLIDENLDRVRYAHLWKPFRQLTLFVEYCLVSLQSIFSTSWAWALVLLTIVIKVLLFPLAVFTASVQRKVSKVRSELEPKLDLIKQNYDGEEAHQRLIAAHKELGVSPFYSLKPMIPTLIQIPILISVFNALGEMPQFHNQSFLWIDNLAYPDRVFDLGFSASLFGSTLNFLPFIMTIITVLSTVLLVDNEMSDLAMKNQKRKLYLMAGVFFLLFYPFPAVMVLYWTLVNLWSLLQRLIFKI